MAHAEVENRTPFAFQALFAADEDGRPLLVPIVKGTFAIEPDGSVTVAEKQMPVTFAGTCYGEPGLSSYKYEPEGAFTKSATDVALIGAAHAPTTGATEVYVRLCAGPLEKTIRVVGDRIWYRSLGMTVATAAEPFETIPLTWEHAFGGWDRSHPDQEQHAFEPRNPVGTGFRAKHGRFEDGTRLPNLEDPRQPLRDYGGAATPAGFGFTSPEWQPRASFGGTYDQKWADRRSPLLPTDFNRRFFSAAAPGLTAAGYFQGDETVSVENASARGTLTFHLPGTPPPVCRVQLPQRPDAVVETHLDTVIIDTDEHLLMVVWRGNLVLPGGPHDVSEIQIQAERVPAPAAAR